jgi:hypothetical protein
MKHLKLGLFLLAGGITTGAWNQLSDSTAPTQERPLQDTPEGQLPVPKAITAKLLARPDANGNNVLVTAAFDKTDPRLRGVTIFKLRLSDEITAVLSDNGTNGDAQANDGIFTTKLREDANVLTRTMSDFNTTTAAKRQTNQAIINFVGRSVVSVNAPAADAKARMAVEPPIALAPDGAPANLPIQLSTQIATAALTTADFAALKTNSLIVNDLRVVQDATRTYNPCVGGTAGGNPNGVWTFKSLLTNMANTPVTGVSADDFVKNWLDTEVFAQKTQAVSLDVTTNTNGWSSVVRDNLANPQSSKYKFIAAWLKNSGFPVTAANVLNWKALLVNKLEFIPLRLLAIVNRLDLRGNFAYTGGTTSGGEGRFVFCFIDSNNGCLADYNRGNNVPPMQMTVILEYGIPLNTCRELSNYANQWYNLKNIALGSSAYNTALQTITDVFTKANAGAPMNRPNKSALNHLRTNEALMLPWNIRDFEINNTRRSTVTVSAESIAVTDADPVADAVAVRRTPPLSNPKFQHLNIIHPSHEPMNEANSAPGGGNVAAKVGLLNAFVNTNAIAILSDQAYTIPTNIQGIDAQMPTNTYYWNSTGITIDEARHKLSLGTCSGCHAGETKTDFTHVKPANFNTMAPLSGFLTGLGADDDGGDNDADPMSFYWVKDPANRPASAPVKRGFNDLLRRAHDLATFVNTSCGSKGALVSLVAALNFQPMLSPH